MYRDRTVGVVVPAYEEEGFVGDVIDTVPAFVDRVYPVDDRSTDGTWAEIREHAAAANAAWPEAASAPERTPFARRVVPIRREENGGVGAAIKTGYRRALVDEIDVIAVMNGDGQMDPDELPRLLDPIVDGTADYAKGNRLVHADHRQGMSRWRLLGNTILSGLTKVASGYWQLTDPQNGYTAVSAGALRRIDLDSVYDDYGFCNHLLVRLNAVDATVVDVAMPAVYGDERSTIRYSRFIPSLSALLFRSFLWRLKTQYVVFGFHPLVALYLLGILGTGAGLAFVGAALGGALGGAALRWLTLGGVGVLVLFLAALSLIAAVLLDMGQNDGLERRRYGRVGRDSVADGPPRPAPADDDPGAAAGTEADGPPMGIDEESTRTTPGSSS
ncbi:MAG: glycosyltransferase family 2 protein [Haloferacaceae archaeon]